MGHDIYGLLKKEDDDEVVYLRRNMWSNDIHFFYQALDAEEYDQGVSGGGDKVAFTDTQIKKQ